MLTRHPTRSERRAVLILLADGKTIDTELHGDTLAVLIGEGCVGLDGPIVNGALSITKDGLDELRRSRREQLPEREWRPSPLSLR